MTLSLIILMCPALRTHEAYAFKHEASNLIVELGRKQSKVVFKNIGFRGN